MKCFWLNVHVNYACRHSGMCCTSGWPIPVERMRAASIERAIAGHRVTPHATPWLIPDGDAPEDVAGMIAVRSNGHCVFFEAGGPGCAVHDFKPAACVHFPHICLIDQRGVHVTLSHYCPTAAAMLFEHTGPVAIVEGPLPVREGDALEGLDARDALPPEREDPPGPKTQDPGPQLMSVEEFSAWEREEVAAARIDGWQADDLAWFAHARQSVPPPWGWPQAPPDTEALWRSLVSPAWPEFADVLHRYAAAKVFASWAAYQGDGLAAVGRGLRIAAAVLRVESARECRREGRMLDAALLTQAIRNSDLLLVHYGDPERLLAPAEVP